MSQKILKLIKQYKILIYFQLDEKKKDEIKCDLLCALKDVNKYLNEKSLLSEKNMNSFKLIIFELLLNIIDERFDATFVSESISLINNLFFLITKVKRTLLLKTFRIIDFTKILIHYYLQIHRKKKNDSLEERIINIFKNLIYIDNNAKFFLKYYEIDLH